MTDKRPPLSGMRVITVSQYGAGPYATQLLGDLGADVIKIENPLDGGDVGRRVPPLFTDGENSLFFEAHNRGKKSVTLNLASEQGQITLRALASQSDVVFNNLRGDVGDKLGLTYRHLKEVNPAIVCVTLSAYGTRGEEATRPGYDYLFQAKAGWMALTGGPEMYPLKSGLSLVDLTAALFAALATVSAYHQAQATGCGGDVETSLYDTALSLLGYIGTWNMSRGWSPERLAHSAHPSVVPFQEFETADGHIVIACVKDKFFRDLCEAMEMSELAHDFPTMKSRQENRHTVISSLAERFRKETTYVWLQKLQGRVPCEPVNSVSEALQGGAVPAKRGLVAEYEHPTLGTVRSLTAPIRGWWETPTLHQRGPFLGEHTDEVLRLVGSERERMGDNKDK
ncbi:CaiB/BaiF CoA transferase family protein [Sulfobacillus harzensis]|uniref:CoA transferase n=1 Tax=Sulfobacillus harzensis TaxID=2729629 RepID=A0A7Y0Q3K7_9FIRM|nr:CoA transferase [Sulfobacillus harzensis]NMP23657.1 CoA transferase [Sulfobacillus harzensis]